MAQILGREERDPQTDAIIGAAMEVHRILGPGFLEPVYQEALAVELPERGILFAREVALAIWYKGTPLDVRYRADFMCWDRILVELKALTRLSSNEEAQVLHYLAASHLELGLLFNFGARSLQFRRFAGAARLLSSSVKPVSSVDPIESPV